MPTPSSDGSFRAPRAGRLALADGSVFHARAFGAKDTLTAAEVVFNTAMTGYQESLTDPSYTGQILVQTFPLIGNTGVNHDDEESRKVQVSGFVVRELARRHSNYRATESLDSYLERAGVLGLEGIDTRALTRRLRTTGSMNGVITDRTDLSDADLVRTARQAPSMAGQNLVPRVGCSSGQSWSETLGEWSPQVPPGGGSQSDSASQSGGGSGGGSGGMSGGGGGGVRRRMRVLALDCGAKSNILRNLADRGCDVKVMPHDTPASEIRRLYAAGEIDGLFISNGPGDPAAVDRTIESLRDLVRGPAAQSPPTFGICLGHQLLALAAGARTYKLKFGHRGANQPVHAAERGRVEITSQNHGFAVDESSLKAAGGVVTHRHLNDQTVAGFRLKDRPVFSVQYHPEASPGPHDAWYAFDEFVTAMKRARGSV